MAIKKTTSFNRIAFAYDFLARLVFGDSIKKAQCIFLPNIPKGARVLIIGGGTGWIIPEIFQTSDICELIYVEASDQMLHRAQSKSKHPNLTVFLLGTEQDVPALGQFDVVITFFFLDLFPPEDYERIGSILYQSLKKDGLWFIADFDYHLKKGWQRLLLRSMYTFFKITCSISTDQLYDTQRLFQKLNMHCDREQCFFHNMIFSRVYQK